MRRESRWRRRRVRSLSLAAGRRLGVTDLGRSNALSMLQRVPFRYALEHFRNERCRPGFSISDSANSRAPSSASAAMRRWSVALCPVVSAAMSDSTRSTFHRPAPASRLRHPGIGKITFQEHQHPASRSIGSRVERRTPPRPPGPPPGSSRLVQHQIDHPGTHVSEQMKPLIQFDQLECRPRPPALRLRRRYIRIIELPRQPALRGAGAAPSRCAA